MHPVYVLERHIGKYQALAPGTKKSGLHRGEAFFHRTALSELHTADRWQREGREVLSEARDNPAKINRRRGFKLPPGMDGKPMAGKVNQLKPPSGPGQPCEDQSTAGQDSGCLQEWMTNLWLAT